MSFKRVWNFVTSPGFDSLLILVLITLAIGTLFYNFVEGWGWIDSMYFSVISLTTVGYGDITPITTVGKIFTMFYLFVGIGILFGFINMIAKEASSSESTAEYLRKKIKREERAKLRKRVGRKLKGL